MDMISRRNFKKRIWDYYRAHKRDLPWRRTRDPYRILVSEVMLQQTQVARVERKYKEFLDAFPDLASLARASLPRVLGVWQGMGYNRRALALLHIAQEIGRIGKFPESVAELFALPGIGKNTAGSILAFAFNKPEVFIETNIRRVFIHFFFPKKRLVRDEEILELVRSTLDTKRPREWYWALMDYGAMLGERSKWNPNRKSAHYRKQSPFRGSRREQRGKIIRLLLAHEALTEKDMRARVNIGESDLQKVIADLASEGFIEVRGGIYRLKHGK